MDLVDLVVVWSLLRLPLPLFFVFFFEVVFILSDFYHLFLLQDSDVAADDVLQILWGRMLHRPLPWIRMKI